MPTTIVDVTTSRGLGGFFFDDQTAIKSGAVRDGAGYIGTPVTDGFASIREPAESVSTMLTLSDGYVAIGDCASVQYTGVGGREPRFHSAAVSTLVDQRLAPLLIGRDVSEFRAESTFAEQAISSIDGLGRAAAYGVSQALLDAAAHARGHHLMARVIKEDWALQGNLAKVPIYAQTGDDRQTNVDKMILKQVAILPHGLINTKELVGDEGSGLADYITWIRDRIAMLSPNRAYLPIIHLDVYGMIGAVSEGSVTRTALAIQRLEKAAGPHQLRIEHPIDAGSRDAQIEALGQLKSDLHDLGSKVGIIADEWANTFEDVHEFARSGSVDFVQIKTPDLGALHNTVDAVLDCQRHGVGAILGGTCAETDISARATTHIGIATGVTQMLAKPGMGMDEGLMIVGNEMNRALRLNAALEARSELAR